MKDDFQSEIYSPLGGAGGALSVCLCVCLNVYIKYVCVTMMCVHIYTALGDDEGDDDDDDISSGCVVPVM